MLAFAVVLLASATPQPPAETPHPPAPAPESGGGGAEAPRTMGGLVGGVSGCAAGVGVPLAGLGAGSGLLYWLYSGAAAGTIVGWTPACTAAGTATSMIGVATCLPLAGAGAATAGAMYGAEQDGRDPLPALLGAIPGLGLGVIATGIAVVAMGVGAAGSIAAIAPVAILVIAATVVGLAAPPCAACGASVADLVWGNPPKPEHEEPLAGTAAAAHAMKF